MRMDKVIQIGNICKGMSQWDNPSIGRVYDRDGICPTLNTAGGGYRHPMIIENTDIKCLNPRGRGEKRDPRIATLPQG